MTKKTSCFLGFLALSFGVVTSGIAQPVPSKQVLAGYDLYQLDRPFLVAAAASEVVVADPSSTGYFNDLLVQGVPLGEFDFGDGAGSVDVGLADTIVQRLGDADGEGAGVATVDIELVALSLRSVDPVDLGDGAFDYLYIGLDPSTPSTGRYNFTFFEDSTQEVGSMDAFFDVFYQVHVGSPDGDLYDSGSVQLGSGPQTVFFSHYPFGTSPFEAGDKTIGGVNLFLDGSSQEGDIFQFNTPLPLQTVGEGETGYFELALQHANSDDPGDTPDNPILPDDVTSDGFIFIDAPRSGWFDPPLTNAYLYETDGNSSFVSIFLPPFAVVPDADGQYLISSVFGDVTVGAGSSYSFPTAVDWFTVKGIDPAVDGGDPLAFPVFLTFDSFQNSFTQTQIPEPAAWLLALTLPAVLAGRKR